MNPIYNKVKDGVFSINVFLIVKDDYFPFFSEE